MHFWDGDLINTTPLIYNKARKTHDALQMLPGQIAIMNKVYVINPSTCLMQPEERV